MGIVAAIAATGALATRAGLRDWYPALTKPAFTPPGWVFGPVWTTLYGTIAVAGWRLWRARHRPGAAPALAAYGANLAANAAWSPLFFGARAPGLALVDLGLMELTLGATLLGARRVDPVASALLVPYAAWTTFAGVLNASIWWLNRGTEPGLELVGPSRYREGFAGSQSSILLPSPS